MPLVVLAAKRAANTGRAVIVATSVEPDDDELVAALKKYDILYYRGSLQNTLDRMVNAVAEYEDETVFIRLTADNVFPDGNLIDEVEADFQSRSLDYLCCNGMHSGLPYGMSVEVTRVKHLREAAAITISLHDQEHVTPFLIRKFGANYFEKHIILGKGHNRCTVDLYADYINICKVFSVVPEPITTPGIDLIHLLENCAYQPLAHAPVPHLVVGTAQIGMNYGIVNLHGQPNISEAEVMLKTAISNGVEYIDTARAYGNSELVIGKCLAGGWASRIKIITKLSPLADCPPNADYKSVKALVDSSVFESCMRLRRQSLDVLMLHRVSHFKEWNGAVWHRLIEHQKDGVINTLGVSVQNPEELIVALGIESVGFIQMPFNIIDWRWGLLQKRITQAKQRRNIVVHVRSVLLQGLLLSFDKALWRRAHIAAPEIMLNWLQKMTQINGCEDVTDLCLRYVRSKPWVDGVVIGMENQEQMAKNIVNFNKPRINVDQLAAIESSRPSVIADALDPSLWL
jgi:aryl-alcohol dehydrogenase-like predicted oxidoreductase/spore coat polysaccharide biosynthesis protein SpsF (cytidylyltransferase family)